MIFLDSSILVSYEVDSDVNHKKAEAIIEKIIDSDREIAISDYVFDEVVTVTFIKSHSLQNAVLAGDRIKTSIKILKVDDFSFENAWNLFKNQETKLSFTDCSILSIMNEYGIHDLATFDKEFKSIKWINVIDS